MADPVRGIIWSSRRLSDVTILPSVPTFLLPSLRPQDQCVREYPALELLFSEGPLPGMRRADIVALPVGRATQRRNSSGDSMALGF